MTYLLFLSHYCIFSFNNSSESMTCLPVYTTQVDTNKTLSTQKYTAQQKGKEKNGLNYALLRHPSQCIFFKQPVTLQSWGTLNTWISCSWKDKDDKPYYQFHCSPEQTGSRTAMRPSGHHTPSFFCGPPLQQSWHSCKAIRKVTTSPPRTLSQLTYR